MVSNQLRIEELAARDVDRHRVRRRGAERAAPDRELLARGGQDHPADRQDQPGLFREADEPGRRDKTSLRMAPAYQRLEGDDAAGFHRYDGLVMDLEGAVRDRLAQIALETEPGARPLAHGRIEDLAR